MANWTGNSGGVLPSLPSGHIVVCDSLHVSPEHPLTLDTTQQVSSVILGRESHADGRVSTLRIGPTARLRTNWVEDRTDEQCGKVVGGAGNGLMLIEAGGEIGWGNLMLGRSVTGVGVVTNAGSVVLNSKGRLYAGYEGKGTFVNAASGVFEQTAGNVVIGNAGTGTFVNYGTVTAPILMLGGATSASGGQGGRFVQKGGRVTIGNMILVGNYQDGVLDVDAGASIFVTNAVHVGVENGATGEVVLRAGASVTASEWNLGGRSWSTGATSDATGIITLKGGTLQTRSWASSGQNMFLPYSPNAHAILRGWGALADVHDNNNNNVRLRMDGQVLADGEGDESHVLDLGRVVSTTKARANGWTGTNGWYAVNKGKLVYPRRWLSSGGGAWTLGEGGAPADIDQVNALGGSISGLSRDVVVKAALYAPDRTDIPAGLLVGKTRVGVWGVWVQTTYSNTTRQSFTKTSLRFRYDHTKVRPGEMLWLMRYNAQTGRWDALLKGVEQPATPVLEVADQTCDNGQSMNVGWYAVLSGVKKGISVIVR